MVNADVAPVESSDIVSVLIVDVAPTMVVETGLFDDLAVVSGRFESLDGV
jgi:hypothetical protein